uniref:Ig-like domain-containing protein n=1 Tax=Methylomonas koyamae TaxID=702114 RepID=UPI000A9B5DF0
KGAVQPGHASVLDRGNVNTGAYAIDLQGADSVTLDHLGMTGANIGVYASNSADSDAVTVKDSRIWGHNQYGLYINAGNDNFTLSGSQVFGTTTYHGVHVLASGARILNNDVYGNAQLGIYSGYNGSGTAVRIEGNKVHDNAGSGIDADYNTDIVGNEVFNQLNNGRYGIVIANSARASANFVHHNDAGMNVTYSAVAAGNEVYANTKSGISLYSATARGNRVYSNSTGMVDTGYATIENNVVYANTNIGIQFTGTHTASDANQVTRSNTLYQPVGDAILIGSGGSNVQLHNNIVMVDAGFGINAATVANLVQSDYNLFHLTQAGARTGLWGAAQQASLADWRTASSKDANSKAGNPLFLDIDGADNVLGEKGLVAGNGFDDNFGLRANSAAIDAANMYTATATDIDGLARRDDPSVANSGDGLPLYVATAQAGSSFANVGTKLNLRQSDYATTYTIPFAFPFYGKTYTTAYINSNGFIQFGSSTNAYNGNNSNTLDGLINNVRIAPLWDNLSTSVADTSRDVYVDATVANQLTVRWAAVVEGTNNPVNFSVTLFSDGRFRFDYGPSASGLTPTVGVSAGNGQTYVLAPYDGVSDLSAVASLEWAATPGLNYYDIGAYEFLGNSNDTIAPQVVSISQLPTDGGTTSAAFSSLQIDFSEALDRISARSPANYELLAAGADNNFGTPDDTRIAVKPGYSFPETNLTLQLTDGVLAEGKYRLRLSGTLGIFDTAGNLLDGNADGVAGGDYLREFTIDRSGNQPPTATDAVASVNENSSVLITLAGTDPNGDPLSFSLVGSPLYGALSDFDPATRTVRYTPNANFNGTDSFKFRVDDGSLGTDDGNVIVNVLPVNSAPVALGASAATDEDTAVQILLPATDLETTQPQLNYALGSAPAHGSLIQGSNGLWTYTPDADFQGTDSFTYSVTDRGDPDGSPGNALTSAPATVTITVRPVNDAPRIPAIAAQNVAEGDTLTFNIAANDPDNASLTYSLVGTPPAGANIDSATGLFSWTRPTAIACRPSRYGSATVCWRPRPTSTSTSATSRRA